ncbi:MULTISPECIES: TIGR04283 family arsenosugar biosynthesis glycosyltransferase [Hyphomicrobiales]|uniref:TIGR04283 family arsenosugar biosynthesis glycosyltransferase n=1 Tax=Xanthobacter autotrophicus TaxID=280 RepID=UPI00372BC9C1
MSADALAGLSIIIPALNEAAGIGETLNRLALCRAQGAEVIVVDGGSTDATMERVRAQAVRVIEVPPGRAVQMNAGARASRGALLLFLHADTALPEEADTLLAAILRDDTKLWGRFDVRITGRHWMLRIVATMMNLRSRITGIATGDQAIFVRREVFEAAGGYPTIPLMEDIALTHRLNRFAKPVCLSARVMTSGRRWETHGVMRTIFLMWKLRLAYWAGADPRQLARRYRNGS